jgi:hypothetical protein
LTAVGPQGIVTARSKNVTKDELFIFDPNHAQISLIGHNGKLVSVKQGGSIFFYIQNLFLFRILLYTVSLSKSFIFRLLFWTNR